MKTCNSNEMYLRGCECFMATLQHYRFDSSFHLLWLGAKTHDRRMTDVIEARVTRATLLLSRMQEAFLTCHPIDRWRIFLQYSTVVFTIVVHQ